MEIKKTNRKPKFNVETCLNIINDYLFFNDSLEDLLKKYDISQNTFYDIVGKKGSYEFLNNFNKWIIDTPRKIKLNSKRLPTEFINYVEYIKYSPEYFNALEEKQELADNINNLKEQVSIVGINERTELQNKHDQLLNKYKKKYKHDQLLNKPVTDLNIDCTLDELFNIHPELAEKVTLYNFDNNLYIDKARLSKINSIKKDEVVNENDIKDLLVNLNDMLTKLLNENDKEIK